GGSYDYRTFTTVNYFAGNWNLSLRWRHLPKIDPAGAATVAGTNTFATSSYDLFDLSGGFAFNQDRLTLRYGLANLLDAEPRMTNASPTNPIGSATNTGFYDVLGRRAYLGLSMTF